MNERIRAELIDFLSGERGQRIESMVMIAFDKDGTFIIGNASKNELAQAAAYLQAKFTEMVIGSVTEMDAPNHTHN